MKWNIEHESTMKQHWEWITWNYKRARNQILADTDMLPCWHTHIVPVEFVCSSRHVTKQVAVNCGNHNCGTVATHFVDGFFFSEYGTAISCSLYFGNGTITELWNWFKSASFFSTSMGLQSTALLVHIYTLPTSRYALHNFAVVCYVIK